MKNLGKVLETALEWETLKKANRANSQEARGLKKKLHNQLKYYNIDDNQHNYRVLGVNDDYYSKIKSVDRFITEKEHKKVCQFAFNEADFFNVTPAYLYENLTLEKFNEIIGE
jgi:hypothetical protein